MTIQYHASPTLTGFHLDDSFVRGVRGPVGSGKSTAMCMEILTRADNQLVSPDGIKKSRWAVIRNTYRELKDTTIKTWLQWWAENVCGPVAWSDMTHHIRSGSMDLEVIFRALDRPDDVKKILSLELTGAWINEAREVPKAILDGLTGRVGRFPNDAGRSWSGIIMDSNPPDDDHWWYRLAEEETPKGWKFWSQPPALVKNEKTGEWVYHPKAENLAHLPPDYYPRMIAGKTEEWIKVYVLGKYGTTADGKPVFPEYNDAIHVAKETLSPISNQPLLLGFDFGLTPACVYGQITPRGVLNALGEDVALDMGIKQFLRDVVVPRLASERFRGLSVLAIGDPAGVGRAQTDERTCFDEILSAGIAAAPASSNDFLPRREAVAGFLTKMVDGKPGFQLDPSCKVLRKALIGQYQFERLKISEERYKDTPKKNEFSHVSDGLQYLCLGAAGGVTSKKRSAQTPKKVNWK